MNLARLLRTIFIASSIASTPAAVFAETMGADQSALAKRGIFFAGGEYVGPEDNRLMHGQMYVEVLTPKEVTQPYPLVLIHGAAQTAVDWMMTPDERKGWADYFVEQGYVVYMAQ